MKKNSIASKTAELVPIGKGPVDVTPLGILQIAVQQGADVDRCDLYQRKYQATPICEKRPCHKKSQERDYRDAAKRESLMARYPEKTVCSAYVRGIMRFLSQPFHLRR